MVDAAPEVVEVGATVQATVAELGSTSRLAPRFGLERT
jgi:hypothetical protein